MYASHVCEAWALFIPTLSVTDTMKGQINVLRTLKNATQRPPLNYVSVWSSTHQKQLAYKLTC